MKIPPDFVLDASTSALLGKIEAYCDLVSVSAVSLEINRNLRRQSLLGSSLFSARIEGNSLSRLDLADGILRSSEKRKLEVANLYRALNFVYENYPPGKKIAPEDFLFWHSLVLKNLSTEAGRWRRELGGVFDSFGNLIHLSVPPSEIVSKLNELTIYVNSETDPKLVPVKACLSHYLFEKIHPFLDANGRVGRLLLSLILNQSGFTLGGLLILEEYLDDHRSGYYRALESSEADINSYLFFMLTALSGQLASTHRRLAEVYARPSSREDGLLPRRHEILNIIREHGLVNFDFLRRRFLSVNQRTLRFDLKKLAEEGFIVKRGETRGVFYSPRDFDGAGSFPHN